MQTNADDKGIFIFLLLFFASCVSQDGGVLGESVHSSSGHEEEASSSTFQQVLDEEQTCEQLLLAPTSPSAEDFQQQQLVAPEQKLSQQQQLQTALADSVITTLAWESDAFRISYSVAITSLIKTSTHLQVASSAAQEFSKQLKKMLSLYGAQHTPRTVCHDLSKGFEFHFKSKITIDASTNEGRTLRSYVHKQIRSFVQYRVREHNANLQEELDEPSIGLDSLLEAANCLPLGHPVVKPKVMLSPSIFASSEEQEDEYYAMVNRPVAPTPEFTVEAEKEYYLAMANPINEMAYPVGDDEESPYNELQKFTAANIAWWDAHFETRDSLALALLQDVAEDRRQGLFLKAGFYVPQGQIVHLMGYLKKTAELNDEEADYAAQLNQEWCVVPQEDHLWGMSNTRPTKQHFRLICCNRGPLRASFCCRGEGNEEMFLKYGGKRSSKVRSISFFVVFN